MILSHRALSLVLLCCCWGAIPVSAQDAVPSDIRLQGLYPTGYRTSVSNRWTNFWFNVINDGTTDKKIRLAVFFEGDADRQFAREVWVPARTSYAGWLPVGPAPLTQKALVGREVQMLLYDLTNGKEQLILPKGEERFRGRAVAYRPPEPVTAIFIDDEYGDDNTSFRQPTHGADVVSLCRVIRGQRKLSEQVLRVAEADLPQETLALEGVEHLVIASKRVQQDTSNLSAVRRWVQQGGMLWVMLDRVDPDILGPILGDGAIPTIVDRTSLNSFRIARRMDDSRNPNLKLNEFDHPVSFARVALGGRETVLYNIDGWPAAFVIRCGKGKILCTTLGPSGWMRARVTGAAPSVPPSAPKEFGKGEPGKGPFGKGAFGKGDPGKGGNPPVPMRMSNDPPSPFENIPDLPVGLDSLDDISSEFNLAEDKFTPDDLRAILTDEIGYTVPGRFLVGSILGGFILALLGISGIIRRSKSIGLVGWLGPIASLLAAGILITLALISRRSIPSTVATVEIAEVIPGSGEAAVKGMFATYRPGSGPVDIRAEGAVILDLDRTGLEGQIYRRDWSDWNRWEDRGVSLPAGVRIGTIQGIRETGRVAARITFGPNGIEGNFESGRFLNPEDVILVSPMKDVAGIKLDASGSFQSRADEILNPGQYLPSAVLTERQQRHLEVYRKLLGSNLPDSMNGREYLLAWANPENPLITVSDATRNVGSSLLLVPLELRRPAPGTSVLIPRSFCQPKRAMTVGLLNMIYDGIHPTDYRVRFQLPNVCLPMTVERAVVHVKVKAGNRRITVSGLDGETSVVQSQKENPLDAYVVTITDPRLLKLDERGGLSIQFGISGGIDGQTPDVKWEIEMLGLEVQGKTESK